MSTRSRRKRSPSQRTQTTPQFHTRTVRYVYVSISMPSAHSGTEKHQCGKENYLRLRLHESRLPVGVLAPFCFPMPLHCHSLPLPLPDGRWPLAVGRWPLAVGRWPLAVGRWPLAVGRWPLAVGRWPLAVGRWPLAVGRWPLAVGRWPLAVAVDPFSYCTASGFPVF